MADKNTGYSVAIITESGDLYVTDTDAADPDEACMFVERAIADSGVNACLRFGGSEYKPITRILFSDLGKTVNETVKKYSEQFKTYHGVITSPGKFEGEPLHVPYLWDAIMNGDGEVIDDDTADDPVTRIHIDADDIAAFPQLAQYACADLWCDGAGFVYCDLLRANDKDGTKAEYLSGDCRA